MRALEIGWQQTGAEADPAAAAVAHLRHLHLDSPDPGLHRAPRQVAVAHHGSATVIQALIRIALQEQGQLRLDRFGDELARPLAQQRVQRVALLDRWL